MDHIVPLDGEIEDISEDLLSPSVSHEFSSDSNEKNDSWQEQKGSRCGNVTVGDLGDWHGGGFGLKLMQKMGYKVGEVKSRVREEIKHAHDSLDADIFSFLNRKLEQQSTKTEHEEIKEDIRMLAKSSTKSLGVKGIDLECELKQLRGKERKLREGIARNKHDKRTVDRMKVQLAELEKTIEKVQAKQQRVHSEIDDRQKKKKKDIF
ncbi:hypothetical protein OSTOST_06618 [Ostertagia ostertagi]